MMAKALYSCIGRKNMTKKGDLSFQTSYKTGTGSASRAAVYLGAGEMVPDTMILLGQICK